MEPRADPNRSGGGTAIPFPEALRHHVRKSPGAGARLDTDKAPRSGGSSSDSNESVIGEEDIASRASEEASEGFSDYSYDESDFEPDEELAVRIVMGWCRARSLSPNLSAETAMHIDSHI
jgi:hypothetical protein